ncbi:MAG: 6,7-dimethyl-8-ribityllumazine synthase [Alphaproteobacteria bacterium]
MKIAIIQAGWNSDITTPLASDAQKFLTQKNVDVDVYKVAGAVELAVAAKNIIAYTNADAVICIGAVILGETDHYHYVAKMAAEGINKVGIETGVPTIFGVLTCPNKKLAMDRVDGTHSRCGYEWAETAMEMANLIAKLKK